MIKLPPLPLEIQLYILFYNLATIIFLFLAFAGLYTNSLLFLFISLFPLAYILRLVRFLYLLSRPFILVQGSLYNSKEVYRSRGRRGSVDVVYYHHQFYYDVAEQRYKKGQYSSEQYKFRIGDNYEFVVNPNRKKEAFIIKNLPEKARNYILNVLKNHV